MEVAGLPDDIQLDILVDKLELADVEKEGKELGDAENKQEEYCLNPLEIYLVIRKIVSFANKDSLPNLRLLSHTWNTLVLERLSKIINESLLTFRRVEDLTKWVTTFKSSMAPFHRSFVLRVPKIHPSRLTEFFQLAGPDITTLDFTLKLKKAEKNAWWNPFGGRTLKMAGQEKLEILKKIFHFCPNLETLCLLGEEGPLGRVNLGGTYEFEKMDSLNCLIFKDIYDLSLMFAMFDSCPNVTALSLKSSIGPIFIDHLSNIVAVAKRFIEIQRLEILKTLELHIFDLNLSVNFTNAFNEADQRLRLETFEVTILFIDSMAENFDYFWDFIRSTKLTETLVTLRIVNAIPCHVSLNQGAEVTEIVDVSHGKQPEWRIIWDFNLVMKKLKHFELGFLYDRKVPSKFLNAPHSIENICLNAPKLEELSLYDYFGFIFDSFCEPPNPVDFSSIQSNLVSVLNVTLVKNPIQILDILYMIFPNVKSFYMGLYTKNLLLTEEEEIEFSTAREILNKLFTLWQNLKDIEVVTSEPIYNFDALLTGLDEKELEDKRDYILNNFRNPDFDTTSFKFQGAGITQMKKLEKFGISWQNSKGTVNFDSREVPSTCISNVSAIMAFKKMPNLKELDMTNSWPFPQTFSMITDELCKIKSFDRLEDPTCPHHLVRHLFS